MIQIFGLVFLTKSDIDDATEIAVENAVRVERLRQELSKMKVRYNKLSGRTKNQQRQILADMAPELFQKVREIEAKSRCRMDELSDQAEDLEERLWSAGGHAGFERGEKLQAIADKNRERERAAEDERRNQDEIGREFDEPR